MARHHSCTQHAAPTLPLRLLAIVLMLGSTSIAVGQSTTKEPAKQKDRFSLEEQLFGNRDQPLKKGIIRLSKDATYNTEQHLLTDERFEFQVEWPAPPRPNDQRLPTESGDINIRVYATKKDDVTFMQIHSNYPDQYFVQRSFDPVAEPDEFLKFTGNTSMDSKKGAKLLHRKKTKLGNFHGLEQAFSFPAGAANGETYPEGVIFQRSYIRRKSLDLVMVQMSRKAFMADSGTSKKMMVRFLDSFKFTNED